MSPDERIKELKKQGYISGVMAGKLIRMLMQEFRENIPCSSYYKWSKLYQHLMDNAKKFVIAERVDVYGSIRWYYNKNDLLSWLDIKFNDSYWLKRHFGPDRKAAEKC